MLVLVLVPEVLVATIKNRKIKRIDRAALAESPPGCTDTIIIVINIIIIFITNIHICSIV